MVAGAATFAISMDAGCSWPLALALALLAVAAIGFVNGWLIAYVEIPAMLATLASAMIITGFFRFGVLRGEFLLLLPKTDPAVAFFSHDILPGLTAPVALMIAALLLTWFLLRFTTFGRITYAMGDNFQAARLTGLQVRTTTLVIYVYAALMALLAGLVTSASSGTVDFRTVTNGTLLFEVILVVVLGGIPLRGRTRRHAQHSRRRRTDRGAAQRHDAGRSHHPDPGRSQGTCSGRRNRHRQLLQPQGYGDRYGRRSLTATSQQEEESMTVENERQSAQSR